MSAPRKRILLVDDDLFFLDRTLKHLTRYGYEVTTAGDVETAAERLRDQRFDVVVTDLLLPRRRWSADPPACPLKERDGSAFSPWYGGLGLVKLVREGAGLSTPNDVPVIAISAAADELGETLQDLAAAVLQKDEDLDFLLLKAISGALGEEAREAPGCAATLAALSAVFGGAAAVVLL